MLAATIASQHPTDLAMDMVCVPFGKMSEIAFGVPELAHRELPNVLGWVMACVMPCEAVHTGNDVGRLSLREALDYCHVVDTFGMTVECLSELVPLSHGDRFVDGVHTLEFYIHYLLCVCCNYSILFCHFAYHVVDLIEELVEGP